jgi:hypothetical protein
MLIVLIRSYKHCVCGAGCISKSIFSILANIAFKHIVANCQLNFLASVSCWFYRLLWRKLVHCLRLEHCREQIVSKVWSALDRRIVNCLDLVSWLFFMENFCFYIFEFSNPTFYGNELVVVSYDSIVSLIGTFKHQQLISDWNCVCYSVVGLCCIVDIASVW